uniref:Diacylglycerol kinase n=1 Tax=Arcella intermedia TaxID=1963864 RepID=A0A6B2L4D2_9EUKA
MIIMNELREILEKEEKNRVFDLKADKGPNKGLRYWKDHLQPKQQLVVIAAGGDGTVGWLLSCVEAVNFGDQACVVPLALGTANDMSRILGWGKGYRTGDPILPIVNTIKNNSEVILLDRWKVVATELKEEETAHYRQLIDELTVNDFEEILDEKEDNSALLQGIESSLTSSQDQIKNHEPDDVVLSTSGTIKPPPRPSSPPTGNPIRRSQASFDPSAPARPTTDLPKMRPLVANNYFSVGIDSEMLSNFDTLRKDHPELFPHRVVNFAWYGLIGLKAMLQKYTSLRHFIYFMADGKPIIIPKFIKALVFMNVPSYSGGTNPWKVSRNADEVAGEQCVWDGKIEVFGMYGAAHFGRTVASMSRGGIRICQCTRATICTTSPIAGQVDGEPYMFFPSKIELSLKPTKARLLVNLNKKKKLDIYL